MLSNVNDRISEYQQHLSYLKGQVDAPGSRNLTKHQRETVKEIDEEVAEMRKAVEEFEAAFLDRFPSLIVEEKPLVKQKSHLGIFMLIFMLIAFLIIFYNISTETAILSP